MYKKLYSYLDSALKTAAGGTPRTGTPRTPRHRDALGLALAGAQKTPTSARNRGAAGVGGKRTPGSTAATAVGAAAVDSAGKSGGRRSTRLPPPSVSRSAVTPASVAKTPTRASTRSTRSRLPKTDSESLLIPGKAKEMARAICQAFDLPEAQTHVLAGCSAVLSLRGWIGDGKDNDAVPESSPALTRKRIRESETQLHDTEERGRKRRRTVTGEASTTETEQENGSLEADAGVKISDDKDMPDSTALAGQITPPMLPSLIVSLSLYTIFTLRGRALSQTEYSDAETQAIASITPFLQTDSDTSEEGILADTEVITAHISAFMASAHTEGWLSLPWSTAVQNAAKENRRTEKHQPVDHANGAETVEPDIEQADPDRAAMPDQEDGSASMAGPASTPRKPARPSKTPLRRKEKHAPRPTSTHLPAADTQNGSAGLKSGLGTMFQDAVDWLAEERCHAYAGWLEEIENRLVESANAMHT